MSTSEGPDSTALPYSIHYPQASAKIMSKTHTQDPQFSVVSKSKKQNVLPPHPPAPSPSPHTRRPHHNNTKNHPGPPRKSTPNNPLPQPPRVLHLSTPSTPKVTLLLLLLIPSSSPRPPPPFTRSPSARRHSTTRLRTSWNVDTHSRKTTRRAESKRYTTTVRIGICIEIGIGEIPRTHAETQTCTAKENSSSSHVVVGG